ncbi:MAG: hypothetical protein ACI4ED_04900 [Suilimivivens sp.]
METAEYLDRLLLRYSGSFDIYQPYVINGKEYPAYGYFFSHIEKYILVREINMWSTRSYEHILFMEAEECTDEVMKEAESIIRDYMEPVLVRKKEKLPEPNHMSSYLNVVIISKRTLPKAIAKKIKHYRFEKGYKFNMRGFSRGTILCVSLEDRKFCSNYHGRSKRAIFEGVFKDVDEGKVGFKQFIEERGITPYKQDLSGK